MRRRRETRDPAGASGLQLEVLYHMYPERCQGAYLGAFRIRSQAHASGSVTPMARLLQLVFYGQSSAFGGVSCKVAVANRSASATATATLEALHTAAVSHRTVGPQYGP